MLRSICLLFAFLSLVPASESQIGRLALSPLQTITQDLAKTKITVTYSRPAMRGRTIFGDLVPYNQKWRTGANRNTTIEFDKEVTVDRQTLAAGKYAIFSEPRENNWTLFFYEKTDNWNIPENWNDSLVVAKITVPTEHLDNVVESLSISIDNPTNDGFELRIYWESTSVSVPISLSTEVEINEIITGVLEGPDADDYFLAAQYKSESGRDLETGLAWINKAIEIRPTEAWYDLMVKGDILVQLERFKEAKKVAETGLSIAKKTNSDFGQRRLNKILDAIPK